MSAIQEVKGSAVPITAEQASEHVAAFLTQHTTTSAAPGVLDDAVADQLRKIVAAGAGQAVAPATGAGLGLELSS